MNKYLNCIHQCIKLKEPLRPSSQKSGGANIVPQKIKESLPYIIGTAVAVGGGIVVYNKLSKKENVIEAEEIVMEEISEDVAPFNPMEDLSFGPPAPIENDIEVTQIEETTDMPDSNPIDGFFGGSLEEESMPEMAGAANTVEEVVMESHPLDSGSGLGDGFNIDMDLEVDEGFLM